MHSSPDPDLRALLRRADPAADLPAPDAEAFARGVRARLAASPASPFRQLFPLAAALALLASLGAGSAAAYAQHRRERTALFADAYAASIDPWLMHHAQDRN